MIHNHQTQWLTQWGGICQGRHATLIPDGYFEDAVNYCVNTDGSLAPRPGLEMFGTCPDGRKPIKVYSADADGKSILIVSTSKHVYLYNAATSGWTNFNGTNYLYEWPTECKRVSFALLNANTEKPSLVMGNGIDDMAVWNIDNSRPVKMEGIMYGSCPKGLPVAYQNYLAVFGLADNPGIVQFNVTNGYIKRTTSATENYIVQKMSDDTYPLPDDFYQIVSVREGVNSQPLSTSAYTVQNNKIRINSTNKPTQIYVNYTAISEDPWLYGGIKRFIDLQGEVTALYPYNGLVIFTDHRTELFSGDPDSPTGKQVLSSTIGCANYESVCEAEGYLYLIAQQGVCMWDGSGQFPTQIISDASGERLSNISEDIRKINWKNRDSFSITYDPINRRIYCFIEYYKKNYTKPGSTPTYDLFDFEIRSGSWYRWQFHEDVPVYKAMFCNVPSVVDEVNLLDGRLIVFSKDSNKIYQIRNEMFTEIFSDLNKEYEFSVKSGAMNFGTMENDKIFRAVTIKVSPDKKSYEGAKEIKLNCYGDCQPTEMGAKFRMSFSFIVGLNLVGDRLNLLYSTEQRRPIAMKSKYFAWELHGKGNDEALPVNAIGISFRPYSNRSTMTWDNDLI